MAGNSGKLGLSGNERTSNGDGHHKPMLLDLQGDEAKRGVSRSLLRADHAGADHTAFALFPGDVGKRLAGGVGMQDVGGQGFGRP